MQNVSNIFIQMFLYQTSVQLKRIQKFTIQFVWENVVDKAAIRWSSENCERW
jgi:hypothetical protein